MISVIILQYNNFHFTKEAIESFRKYHHSEHEIILVDNGSTDSGWENSISHIQNIKLIRLESNLGFGPANNLAAKKAAGDILLFLNNDTVTTESYLEEIEKEFTNNPGIGIIGPKILNPDKSLQLSFGNFPTLMVELVDKILYRLVDKKSKTITGYFEKKYSAKQFAQWVTGAALFIKKDLFLSINGFDESFFMYFEDKELCKRVSDSGYKIMYFPAVSLIHLRGGSAAGPKKKFLDQMYRKSQIYYYTKHNSKFEQIVLRLYLKISGKKIG